MRTLVLILLTVLSLLRLGAPVPCACGAEFSGLGRAGHDEPLHAHENSLGCDGGLKSCDGCLRCQAESERSTETSIPRVIEAQRHRSTVLPTLILDAFHAAAALHDSSNAARLVDASPSPLRPPPASPLFV